jgi:hypothetical protein
MNCLQSRRLLLALPRAHSDEHRTHIDACPGCARLTQELEAFGRDIEDAALVPIPDSLVDRILLRRKHSQPIWQYATAAILALAAVGIALVAGVAEPYLDRTVEAVGPTHPAVVAIAEVTDEQQELVQSALGADDIHQDLQRLGLKLKPGEATAYHLGKCRIQGGGDCDHIVVSTHDVHADVMLLEHYPHSDRLLVADRQMVALLSPTGSGVYIVVAQSSSAAKRVEKLFVKS